MNSAELTRFAETLSTLADTLAGRRDTIAAARSEIVGGLSDIAESWEGDFAADFVEAKDTWLTGIDTVPDAITRGLSVLEEWAGHADEMATQVRRIESQIDCYAGVLDVETGEPMYTSELATCRNRLEALATEWPITCTDFGSRLTEPVGTITTASRLHSLPDGPMSQAEYFVAISYLVQSTGVDIELIDPEGDFDAAAAAALDYMTANPELFTALDALTAGSVAGADNHWDRLNFEIARDHPELAALLLREYAGMYGQDWSDDEIQSMVAQLTVFGAVLLTAPSEQWDEADDVFVDPNVERVLRNAVAHAQDTDGFAVWVNEHVYPNYEDWWHVGDDPNPHVRLLRSYAEFMQWEDMSTFERAADSFRNNVFNYECFYGENADAGCAAWQLVGVLPYGALAHALRHSDELIEGVVRRIPTPSGASIAAHSITEGGDELVESAIRIGDDAAENLDEVDELLPDKPGTDPLGREATAEPDFASEPDADSAGRADHDSDGASEAEETSQQGHDAVPAVDSTGPYDALPGGSLEANEAAGGHVIERHVGHSDDQLVERANQASPPTGVSTFADSSTAETLINSTLARNELELARWLESGDSFHIIEESVGSVSGRYVARGSDQVMDVTGIRLVLIKDPSVPQGFIVRTGYPVP